MSSSSSARRSLVLALVAATSLAGAGDASAQNLFDRLFGNGRATGAHNPSNPHAPARRVVPAQRQAAPGQQPASPQAGRQPAPIVKISGPSYYTYKTPALVKVDFAKLHPSGSAEVTGSIEPVTNVSDFDAALAALGDFDLLAEKDVAAALEKHYAERPGFIWIADGQPHIRAQAAMKMLEDAASYGLEPADYRVSPPASGAADKAALMRFEMAMSARVLRYIRDAHAGRINPNLLSGYHDFAAKDVDYAYALDLLSSSFDITPFLERQHPQNAEYAALRAELKRLRASTENRIDVDPKLLLKPGQSSAELPKLLSLIDQKADAGFKTRHGAAINLHGAGETYTPDLVPVIKAAQEAYGLKPDGVVGPRTVAAIAGISKASRIDKLVVALEQLRWHPSDLGRTHVFLNAAAFTATYRENGVDKLTMRTVVGRPGNQTSFFQDELSYIEYNPYWGVPRSILVNEMLPRLRSDPGYLDRAGYEVIDSKGRRIPSSSINWAAHGANIPYDVRQTPSEANALGELKIMFPNKHAIYMHDTPQKSLFSRDSRAFSHGCVRLADPRGMAAAVLGTDIAHVERKLAQGHNSEKIERKIPVYVAYFTAWPDASGEVAYVPDIYDRDSHVMTALDKTADSRAPAM